MHLDPLPSQASWRHHVVGEVEREAFEVVWPLSVGATHRLRGATTGVEAGAGWQVAFEIDLDEGWVTRTAVVRVVGRDGAGEVLLECEQGRWTVDGRHRPDLEGLVDVDLEASVVTNTVPMHRLELVEGRPVEADAVFVRLDLRVERLAQTYQLLELADDVVRVAYAAPDLGVARTLVLDGSGLVVDYPGLASRHG